MLFPGATQTYRDAVLATHATDSAATESKLKYPNWGLGDLAGTLIATIVIGAFVGVFMLAGHVDPKHGWALILTLSTPWVPMVLYPTVATHYKGNGIRIDFGLTLNRQQIRLGVFAGIACLGLASATGWVSTKIFGPISSAAGDLGSKEHGLVRVVFALLVVLGAPVVEEIVFRGLLLGSLLKREMETWLALVISALGFSLFHFEPKRFLILFVSGLVLGLVRIKSGSTAASTVAHAVNNLPGALVLLFGTFH